MTHAELIERLEKVTEWKPVPGWHYEASDTGLLRSLLTGRVLRPTVTWNGYEKCTFQHNKRRKDIRVHRAIAEAWHGAIPIGFHVNHIDGDKLNNAPSNLEIVTPADNERHATALGLKARGDRNGTHTKPERVARGERATLAKLTESDIPKIRAERAAGAKLAVLAERFGVDQSLISQICRRKIWTHI